MFLLLISILVCANPVSLLGADLGRKSGTQWSPVLQWTLTHPTWQGNAFDLQASVTFRHQGSDETRVTQMFYRGGDAWSFRFTGTHTGTWSLVTASDDEDLDGHTGQVLIAPNQNANQHGFLKKFGDKWGWQGTETVFVPQLVQWDYIAGGNSPALFHNQPGLVEEKIDLFLDQHGFNGFHLPVVGGRWFAIDADSDRVENNMTNPDLRTFEALELLISKTHRAGGMVHIWPWGDHQRSQTARSLTGGMGGGVDRRLQRYVAARLGPLPGWSMGYGFDLDEWVTADEVRTWHNSMHQAMGWHHFLGGRPVGPNHGTDHSQNARWNRGLDYSSYEHHRPTYEVYRAALEATSHQPVMSEDRFRIRQGRYPQKDYNEELTRRGLYHATMAGGVANIWGMAPDLSSAGLYPNQEQIKTYAVFFHHRGRFLADMTPANHLSCDNGTRILLSPKTQSLVLYREDTDAIWIDLSGMHGPVSTVAVDTKKPYTEIPLADLKPKAQTLKLPSQSDWVVAVGRFRKSTP